MNIYDHPNGYRVTFPYNKEFLEKFKTTMQGRRWEGETKSWIVPITPHNLFNLAFWQGDESLFIPYDTQVTDPNIPDLDKVIEFLEPLGLWSHQKNMFLHLLIRRQCIIAGEMRTGKTKPTLAFIEYSHLTHQLHGAAYWVAPKSAIRGIRQELIKWKKTHLPIILMTYDKFRSLFIDKESIPTEAVSNFIVFDEAHKLKNPNSKQSQAAENLTQLMRTTYPDGVTIVLMSGTPSPKDPSDWWNLAAIAQPGYISEGSKLELTKTLADTETAEGLNGPYLAIKGWKKNEVERLYRRLKGLVEVYLKKDCLDLPDKQYEDITLEVSNDYAKMASFIKSTTESAVEVLNKLRQISDGFLYENVPDEETATYKRVVHRLPNCPKDDALIDHLDQYSDIGRLVVYCGYQETTDKVVQICLSQGWCVLKVDGRGWETHGTIFDKDLLLNLMDRSYDPNNDLNTARYGNNFNDSIGGISDYLQILRICFVAQADSASTGIELSASPAIIYYSNSFNGASRMQSEDRAYSNNMDKQRGLTIFDYIHLPTDRLVRDALVSKKTLQSVTMGEIFDCLGDIIKQGTDNVQ